MVEPADINTGLMPGFKFEAPGSAKPAEKPIEPIPPNPSDPPEPKIELIPNQPDEIKPGEVKPGEQPIPGAINEEEIITKILGEGHSYKSFAELEQLKIGERLSQLEKLNEEHVRAKTDLDKYKSKAALIESPQFLSATKYSQFVKEAGVDVDFGTFKKLEQFDPQKISDIEALVLADYLKFGDKGRTIDRINYQFKLGDYAPEIEDEEGGKSRKENAFDRQDMEREAAIAKKELSQYHEKINGYKPEFQDTNAEREARQAEWKTADAAKKMVPFFKAINTPIQEVKGIKIDAQYQFTPQDQVEIEKEIQREIEARDLPLTQESVDTVYGSVMATMAIRKDKERFEVFADKLWSAIDMSLKARYSNYQGLDFTPERKAPVEKQARTDGAMTPSQLAERQLSTFRR